MKNPLLENHRFPPFNSINNGHIETAIEARIQNVFDVLEQCLQNIKHNKLAPSWDNLVGPLEEAQDLLNQAWSPVSHLNGVCNSEELRAVYGRCLQKLTEFATSLDQHKPLFLAYKQLAESDAFNRLDSAQQKVIHDALKDFRLAGVDLDETSKARYGELQKRLSELSTQFSNNVLDATAGWYWHTDNIDDLAGVPATAIDAAKDAAEKKSLQGYVITLDFPPYLAVMTHCHNRALRELLYRAFVTRASELGMATGDTDPLKWDNTAIINEILALRHELAELLGFHHYAELSLAKKMADQPSDVIEFLLTLAERSKPYAEADLAELTEFADIDRIESWDFMYYSEKLKQAKYAVSQEELRPYFPANKVIEGMFTVASNLFGITIEDEINQDVWHPDVRFYRIKRDGNIVAYFYLDLYAREHKRGGAWMADARTRRLQGNSVQLPIAYLTCNFSAPAGGKPSLLTFDEVTTLFHEFGHGLHHMLTEMVYAAVSGISGVPWDAVDLPSQFLENWCWQK